MNSTRLAVIAASTTTVLWAAKAAAIAVAGGLGKSPLEGPLFLLGLLAAVVSAGLVGAAFARRRATLVQVLAALAGIVVASLYGAAEGAVVAAAQPAHPGWVWGELNLWVLALTLLAVALVLARRPSAARDSERRTAVITPA